MKTTLEIPDDLLADAASFATREGRALSDMVAEGLRRVVTTAPARAREPRLRVRLPIIECGAPGTLNFPDDAASRLDTMEDAARHAASLRQQRLCRAGGFGSSAPPGGPCVD